MNGVVPGINQGSTAGLGGKSGSGGAVTVSTMATVTTSGDSSGAIDATSVGRGGGTAGRAVNVTVVSAVGSTVAQGGSVAKGGPGGAVTVVAGGDLTTEGNNADGIGARSSAAADMQASPSTTRR